MKINFDINCLKVRTQYILPKKLLTRLVGLAAGAKMGQLTTMAIENFAQFYHINTDEMEGKISDFQTFNEFFARALKQGARPIDTDAQSVVFPADGRISQLGTLKDNLQIQAKGHYFTIEALLGNEDDAAFFTDGSFATVYLSPSDYHRVHIPFAGKLAKMTYIPGELFSVNPIYTQRIPELFSRNERVVCLFDTSIGKMAVILVGAAIVRSIATVWDGIVAPNKTSEIFSKTYEKDDIRFEKGDEIGRFMMGSTVICLFEKNKINFADFDLEQHVQMGHKMAMTKK